MAARRTALGGQLNTRSGRPAVMTDVAQLAGVSHQTVSRVVNDHPHVRPETRARVLEAMDRLGYRRNLAARALATRTSDTIGVIAFDTSLYGPASTLFSIEQAARQEKLFVSIATVSDMSAESFSTAVDRLLDQSVAGVIVMAPQRSAVRVLAGLPPDLPAVAVEGGSAPGVPSVIVDQLDGAMQVTRLLLRAGHLSVAHIAGRVDWLEAEARQYGWQQSLQAVSREVLPVLPGDWTARSGYEAGRQLLRDPVYRGVTAVFAANDHMALGLLRALAEAGVDVPGQISVVGFDDISEAEYLHPPLTTVRQDFAEVGRRCVGLLQERIALGPDLRDRPPQVVPATLVVRRSTGPPPS